MSYNAPRGTNDILGYDIQAMNKIFNQSREIFSLFGFSEIATPVFEDSRLFVRSLGESSDIVNKQMLNLATKENPLTLRPEGTAAVIRAYLEHHLDKEEGFKKLFYIGPMFRGERPQKGRLRQFTHIGAEAIGSYHPALDAEMILLVSRLLNNFGISGYSLVLNSLGCEKDKDEFRSSLKKELSQYAKELCPDCKERVKKNVLRVLDCKVDSCKAILEKIHLDTDFRCQKCEEHFQQVKKYLQSLKVAYKESHLLVRGLDYYTGTVFEITHQALGSQDALGAGGRYDNLVKQLGGPDLGAVGFALGVERLMLVLKEGRANLPEADTKGLAVFVAVTKDEFFSQGLSLLSSLRDAGISADIDYTSRSLKAQMRRANDLNASLVILLGDEEVKNAKVSLKDMKQGTQEVYAQNEVIAKIKERLGKEN